MWQLRHLRLSAAIFGGALALSSCSKLSQVGQLSQPAPSAVVATVAQPYTTDNSGVLHTTVRAGADVVLTGTNSEKGKSDTGVPIITYSWQQLNAGDNQVDLIRRTPDTVSFTAPQVTAVTTLTIQLTVADADGVTAKTTAEVTVEPVRDADHFLKFLSVNDAFTVTAVTSAPVPAAPTAASSATLPFAITVTKLVSFTDINGVQRSMVAVGQPVTYTSGWSASLGSGGPNCADARNPQLQIPIPRLNLDDELADGSGRLSDVLETSDIDLDPVNSKISPAVVYAQIEIKSTTLPSATTPEVCVSGLAAAATVPASLVMPAASVTASSDGLIAAVNGARAPLDTSASAHAYYDTIDPTHVKGNLTDWLTQNGFNPNVSGWAADAHAVYTNNFDLGFGRDMYLKFGACDNGAASLPLQQRIGKCDVATVVVNYASDQAAANRVNPIVAVAMEYSAVPGTGARFVKFYTFAPDTRTGAFQRVTSVDLDHRGQQSMPQACVVCHGGTPGTVTTSNGVSSYSAPTYLPAGNVGAGFLSWDLDSFFFSDTDPGFSQKAEDAALKAQYTRANQETQFKMLNSGAYLTLDDPNRFALERELLEGWYGGVGLPNGFTGTFVPVGWQPGGANSNPADSGMLYSNVFARSCRACHVLQAPPAGIDPRTAAGTDMQMHAAASCGPAATTSGAVTVHQVPMGCYWEFASATNLAQRLSDGDMPFARRTMDRLWVQPDGSASAGTALQSHFSNQSPAVPIATPGTSIARISAPPQFGVSQQQSYDVQMDTSATQPLFTGGVPADIGGAVRLDGTASAFPDVVSWSVNACTGTPLSPGQCQRPLSVVGADSALAWFVADDALTYQVSLSTDSGQGLAAATPIYFQVPLTPPAFNTASSLVVSLASQINVSLTQLISQYGNGGIANNLVLLQPGNDLAVMLPTTATQSACTTPPGCSANSIPTSGFLLQSTGGVNETSSLTITVTALGSSAQATQSETVPVSVVGGLQAPNLTFHNVMANSTTPTTANLQQLLNASGSTFPQCMTAPLVQNVTYQGGRQPTISNFDPSSQVLSYQPQPGFATYSNNAAKQSAVPQETFTYTVACTLTNSQPGTSSPQQGTITVPVLAREFFTDVQNVWLSSITCNGCHAGTTPSAPTLGAAGYSELRNGNTHDTVGIAPDTNQSIPAAIPFVDSAALLGTPPNLMTLDSNSALLCWPMQSCFALQVHGGTDLSGDPTLMTIRKWLEDGANDF
jgi:hypothetical protein